MEFNIDNPWWKAVVVLGLVGASALARRLGGRAAADEAGKPVVETLDSLALVAALVLFVIQPFILQAFYIPSSSMEDTLRISDRLLVSRLIYRLREPQFQDVIVFEAPATAGSEPGTDFIKRCIGTPGDVIEMKAGVLFRNGQQVAEVYPKWNGPDAKYDLKIVGEAVYSRERYAPGRVGAWSRDRLVLPPGDQDQISAAAPGRVPAGHLLMLGDHRSDSHDGHDWGFAPRENVIGKAICVFWPPQRVGLLDDLTFHPRPVP